MSSTSLIPRQQTYDVLASTSNPAAAEALLGGLTSSSPEVRTKCIKILLSRPEIESRAVIVSQWNKLDATTRASMANNKFELQPAARDLLCNGSLEHKQAAIQAVCDLDVTSALAELIPLALDKQNPVCDAAMKALFELCRRWGSKARSGQDVPTVRSPMLDTMARVIHEYPMHKNTDIIDAWLMLVTWEDSAQRAVINDPLHPAFRAVLQRFWHGQHPSILELLGGYLWRGSTPKSVLSVLCERPDHTLAIRMAEIMDDKLVTAALRRLRELPPMASLSGLAVRSGLTADVQRKLWLMLSANSPSIEPVLSGAVAMSKLGTAEGRRLAAEIVRNCRRKDLQTIVQHLQHASANPEDARSVGAHLQVILGWIGGASTVLNTAACEFFAECTLDRLLEVVRQWPAPLCRALAQVVCRLDPEVVPQLLRALESPAPRKRIIALQAIRLMDLKSEINERLLPLVHDPRLEVRIPAIDLLAALGAPQLIDLLPELLDDATTDVQEAAQRAQRRLVRRVKRTAPIVVPINANTVTAENAPC